MEEIDKFKSAISPFLETWDTIEIKAIADVERNILISMVSCLSFGEAKPIEMTDAIACSSFDSMLSILSITKSISFFE